MHFLYLSVIALFPNLVDNLEHAASFTIATGCLLYFLASIARSRGKFAEVRLVGKWGGWPTTILLRYQDQTIDKATKARYHKELSSLCGGLQFPSTASEEAGDPQRADELYRSAIKKLIELRRGPQYSLIHAENVSYGFRRNLFGLKPAATVIIMAVSFLTAGGWFLVTPTPYNLNLIVQSALAYPHLPLLLLVDIGYAVLWAWAIQESFVFQAGKEYAEALLRTLDQRGEAKK